MALYLGCPVWGQKTWVGNFLPRGTKPRDFLRGYSRLLNTVEGNTTFYALPDIDTTERWRDETPHGFKFCLKVPRSISHERRLVGAQAETAAFVDRLARLRDRCGPVFLQLPPSFGGAQLPALAEFLRGWPRDFRIAVEPRHRDFFDGGRDAFDELLKSVGAARCEFDTRGLRSAPPEAIAALAQAQERKPDFPVAFAPPEAGFSFVRYCGHPDVGANATWLAEWAGNAARWLFDGADVFFFTHHIDDTYAPSVARLLHGLVAERFPALPPLPDWRAPGDVEEPIQPGLF